MKLIFAGTPDFAAEALQALLHAGHEVALVLTQPDRPAGRGMSLTMSPVKQLALANGLKVLQPNSLKQAEIQEQLKAVQADAMIVAAYGLILPREVLAIPRLGCLNIHASLLPRWRGAAPIQRAILAGDSETGITIMQMDAGLDTGPMLSRFPLAVGDRETAQTLHDKLAALGAEAIVSTLERLRKETLPGQIQDDSQATYAAKLSKAEARLDWRLPARELERAVRAYNPFPVAQGAFKGEVWRIWQAAAREESGPAGEILRADRDGLLVGCGQGALLLQEVQKAGGKRLSAAQFLQGNPVTVGERFDA
ncbi:MAG: methionyl-tRNA formyltransferase [Nitrosomonadales bacterium]|nr:MAG: methionyl-tRNA formyltransferase [Nitrosomonadales bacterium]